MLLIDPWNEIEHARKPGESTTEYIGKSIRQIKRFARQYEVAVIVIAHPVKDINEKGRVRVPNLYDIEGSAAWANKADHGICVHRPDPYRDETSIFVQKVRFEETGEKGEIKMAFDRRSGTYGPLQEQQAAIEFER
jgi:twinkle protein